MVSAVAAERVNQCFDGGRRHSCAFKEVGHPVDGVITGKHVTLPRLVACHQNILGTISRPLPGRGGLSSPLEALPTPMAHESFRTILAVGCPRGPIPFVGKVSAGPARTNTRSTHESVPVVYLHRAG